MKLIILLLVAACAHAQNEQSGMVLAKENIGTYIEKRLYPNALYQPTTFTNLGTQKQADSVTMLRAVKHNFCVAPYSFSKKKEEPICLDFIFFLNTKMEVVMAQRIR